MSQSDTAQTSPLEGYLSPDRIEMLVVHCSDTPDDQPIGAKEIQEMHLGFGWDGIGYHQVIRRDGTREAGRPEYWQGAHVKGVNDRSLSVCLIGRNEFTDAQMNSLASLLFDWTARYPDARVLGHRDATETHKTCPNFDAAQWWEAYQAQKSADGARVAVPVLGITAEPGPGRPLETEALFGENLDILEREDLIREARRKAGPFRRALRRLERHPIVGEVRTAGLMGAVEFVRDPETRAPFADAEKVPWRVRQAALDRGLILRAGLSFVVTCPPLIVTAAEIEEIVDRLDGAISDVAAELGF